MTTTRHDTLASKFASLFDDPDAQEKLSKLGKRLIGSGYRVAVWPVTLTREHR